MFVWLFVVVVERIEDKIPIFRLEDLPVAVQVGDFSTGSVI